MAKAPQTYANHTRWVVGYHVVTTGLLLLNLVWSVVQLFRQRFAFGSIATALLAVALILLALYARAFAVTVQDRVIRLEMRLRLQQLLPADLAPRIGEFTVAQLVGLRFASDAELPALARRVLDEKIASREAIKKLVKDWVPDELRA